MSLCIVNPISGNGRSIKIYKKYFKHTKLFRTEYHNHVYDYFMDNLEKIKGYEIIISVGGDGNIHQIINCLIRYKLDIPIIQIPTGSGNGLFHSICYERNLIKPNMSDALRILDERKVKKLDIMKVNDTIYSFLAISWGFISDCDLKTEWLRCLGPFRYDIGSIINIIRKKSYKGTLEVNGSKISGNFVYLWVTNLTYPSIACKVAPDAKCNDGLIHISYITEPITRYEMLKLALQFSSGKFLKHPKVNYVTCKEFKLSIQEGDIVIDGERSSYKEIEVKIHKEKVKILG